MEPLMLALIAIGLLVILVMIIYLTERVNSLEKRTQEAVHSMKDKSAEPKGVFAGLANKKLWDVMTGQIPEGLDEDTVGDVRERYQVVLQKHVEGLFSEGLKDGQRGLSGDPKNTRWITTLRGQVESWLPQMQVNAIYKAGLDAANCQTAEQQLPIRVVLQDACQNLYTKTQIELPHGLIDQMLPPMAAAPSGESDQAQASLPAKTS